jgi:hypothetical protein
MFTESRGGAFPVTNRSISSFFAIRAESSRARRTALAMSPGRG